MPHPLSAQIEDRTAVLSILGLGYVGLPLAVLLVKAGFRVIGFDPNSAYVGQMKGGASTILDVASEDLQACLNTGRFQITSDASELSAAGVYIICVPTPLSKSRQPDMSYIESALGTLLTVWGPGKLAILESTTYPGTTMELLLPALSAGGLKLDEDFLLAFSPERVDPGNTQYPLHRIPKVVGGASEASTHAAACLYGSIFEQVHPVSTPTAAELTKLLENTFRNVNIALVNEFSQICDALHVDVWEVIAAAKTKPFGFMPFFPGPGIGGHCIPLDPQYLVYKSRLSGYEPRLVALADQINQERPRYVVQQAMEMLNEQRKALKGARVLVMGVAYKPDVPDARESPALPILELLIEKGADVRYIDPWIPMVRLENGHSMESVQDFSEEVRSADLVMILTAHRNFDFSILDSCLEKVLDTRNAMGPRK